jgi:hypothetical protein
VTAIRRTFAAFALLFAFAAPALAAPVQGYQVVKTYPHRIDAFTEGLFYKDGVLFESTGLEGASSIRKVKLETGEIIQAVSLPKEIFGEGLIWEGDHLINLTWKSEVGLIVDINSFQLKSTFKYKGEGWGLTRNDQRDPDERRHRGDPPARPQDPGRDAAASRSPTTASRSPSSTSWNGSRARSGPTSGRPTVSLASTRPPAR